MPTYFPGLPSSCGEGVTTVAGTYGPNQLRDQADLSVSDNGSVIFDANNRGLYNGHRAKFEPKQG